MKKERILVTGGAGFIASHIVDAYVAQGHQLAIVDNLSTGFRKNLNAKAHFYKTDIRDLAKLRKVFASFKPTVVNHHAAYILAAASVHNPLETIEVNVDGAFNLLQCAKEYGVKRFLFASTSSVYGEPVQLPAHEKHPIEPLSPYGLSKFLAEHAIAYYARSTRMEYVIFRYGNVYGPRQNPKGEAGVVAIFGLLMKQGKQPTIFGKGEKTRDYVYVDDIVRANVLALTKGKNEVVNIGWGKKVSDRMIFDTVAKHAGFSQGPVFAPYRPGEVAHISLKPHKAQKVLGWKPRVTLSEGIAKTLQSL